MKRLTIFENDIKMNTHTHSIWIDRSRQTVLVFFILEFGSACHLGVSADIACIGVAKKLFQVDGLEKDENHLKKVERGSPLMNT